MNRMASEMPPSPQPMNGLHMHSSHLPAAAIAHGSTSHCSRRSRSPSEQSGHSSRHTFPTFFALYALLTTKNTSNPVASPKSTSCNVSSEEAP